MVTPVKISLKKNEVVRRETASTSSASTAAAAAAAAPKMPKIMLNKLSKEAEEGSFAKSLERMEHGPLALDA